MKFAIVARRWNTVGVLLQHGVDVNAKDTDGDTPLMLAVNDGAFGAPSGVVRLLLEHKANIEAKDNNGETPLMCAQHYLGHGRPDIVALLRHAGAKK